MGPITALSIYLVFWWVVLLVILPLGAQSYHEAGIEVTDGGDPGAPVNPNIKRKFITTTWVSAIIFALFYVVVRFNLITLPDIAKVY